MLKYMNNIIRKAKNWTREDLETLKYIIIGGVVADLFGVYWFLGWKQLAIGILMFLILFLVIILVLDKRRIELEEEEKPKIIKTKPKKPSFSRSYGIQLPKIEDIENRLQRAIN